MSALVRIGSAAAIAGGALRIANVFTGRLPPSVLSTLYWATDVLLLAGIAGVWAARRKSLGVAGTIGLVVFVAGILAVRASSVGFGSYMAGALIALIGLVIYSVEALIVRVAAPWAPVAWLLSFAAALLSTQIQGAALLAASALLFGLGFIGAGLETMRR